MATAAVIGLSAGKRLLSSSFYYSDIAEKLSYGNDYGLAHHQVFSSKKVIMAKKESSDRPSFLSNRRTRSIRALREHADTACDPSTADVELEKLDRLEEERPSMELSVDALILLQKSMLEKQWNLSTEEVVTDRKLKEKCNKIQFARSGSSARKRRFDSRKKVVNRNRTTELGESKQAKTTISPELLRNRPKGYVRGVTSEQLLTHSEVVQLSKLVKIGLHFDERRSRLKERLGSEPLEEQLASSLGISRTELRSKWIESSLALDKLAMSNVRLVMSIAQRYDNMGVEMADLIQGGLIGLIRGIQKFDSSKGCKISTYVYWWIRQGVARAFFENSTTVRSLPTHLHERLNLIRGAKFKLKAKGLTPSTETIAACLNMSQQKVRNATEAVTRVFSLDRDAFPSLNGLPGETLHSYIADDRRENDPWVRIYGQALKDEVKKILNTKLGERERYIIRLYYGMDGECLTWEDISSRWVLLKLTIRSGQLCWYMRKVTPTHTFTTLSHGNMEYILNPPSKPGTHTSCVRVLYKYVLLQNCRYISMYFGKCFGVDSVMHSLKLNQKDDFVCYRDANFFFFWSFHMVRIRSLRGIFAL